MKWVWFWWWWFLSILFEASDSSENEPEDGSDRFRFHCCWVFKFSCWMFLLLCPHATSCNAGFSRVISTYKTPRANWSQLTVLPCKSEAVIIQWLWKNTGATARTKEPSRKCVESWPEDWFIGSSTDPMVQEMFGWRRLALCWSLEYPWNSSCCLYLRFGLRSLKLCVFVQIIKLPNLDHF